MSSPVLWTVGHSNRTLEAFIGILREHRIALLADVRTLPRSRHNPQFNRDSLPAELERAGIAYQHEPGLGGLRKPRHDSINTGWQNPGFRGYADYMQTPGFDDHLKQLIALAAGTSLALMCAEAVPWRCHRSLIADALTVRGIEVRHLLSSTQSQLHRLTPFARADGTRLTYPGVFGDGTP